MTVEQKEIQQTIESLVKRLETHQGTIREYAIPTITEIQAAAKTARTALERGAV